MKLTNGTELRQERVVSEAMVQLPPQRTAKLWRAFRLVGQLFNWRHFSPDRCGGGSANGFDGKCLGGSSAAIPEAEATARLDWGYQVVRLVVALILLTAAALKGYDLSTNPVVGGGLLESRLVLIGVVEMEILFGLWLVANILPKLTWLTALTCFSLFTCVSLYKAISGYASCGCFGRVPVNPWYTTTLDFGIILSLLRWRPARNESWFSIGRVITWGRSRFSRNDTGTVPSAAYIRVVVVLVVWLVVGLPAAYAMTSFTPITLSDAGDFIGDGKVVVLEPEKWVGKRFPLLDYIDIGDKLREGRWLVLLYHHDCPKCQKIIRDLPQLAHAHNVPQIALLEMPPYPNSTGIYSCFPGIVLLHGRFVTTRIQEWFVETPAIIESLNGYIVQTHQARLSNEYAVAIRPRNGLTCVKGQFVARILP